jgi:hypothetical protein
MTVSLELDCHASVTGTFQVNRHHWLSVSAREVPVLTPRSGTRRARDAWRTSATTTDPQTFSLPCRFRDETQLLRCCSGPVSPSSGRRCLSVVSASFWHAAGTRHV